MWRRYLIQMRAMGRLGGSCHLLPIPSKNAHHHPLSNSAGAALARLALRHRLAFFSTDKQENLLGVKFLLDIKKDLLEADVNHDGRIDFEELKMILRKYSDVFSNEDVERIGELFYVGRNAESVSHTTFLRAIQHVAVADDENNEETNSTRRQINPLQLENIPGDACWERSQATKDPFANTQDDFDRYLGKYIQEVLKRSEKDKNDDGKD